MGSKITGWMVAEEYARRKFGVSRDWHWIESECIKGGSLITGCEMPLITRGRNKGWPNYRRRKIGTEIKFVLTGEDAANLLAEMEAA